MNCQTFEPTINDLARGQLMEAAVRESALLHAENCARCKARLSDEQALQSSLRAFAASSETLAAPAHIETALRAAFRQRRTSAQPSPMISRTPARAARWTVWATTAAAAVLTVFAIQAFRLRPQQQPVPLHRAGNTASLSSINEIAYTPAGTSPAAVPVKIESVVPVQDLRRINAPARRTLSGNNLLASRNALRSTEAAQAVGSGASSSEIVTDFMPLTYGAALSPNEGGQLVRVELPRSALASLGLPINLDKADGRVKADVLLGHDGLARAIRFVR
ncbi:MAG TPA: hypothetical protein VGC64_00910 [Pyrinomonadaceae bacterium]|jgi:hypothetical protein